MLAIPFALAILLNVLFDVAAPAVVFGHEFAVRDQVEQPQASQALQAQPSSHSTSPTPSHRIPSLLHERHKRDTGTPGNPNSSTIVDLNIAKDGCVVIFCEMNEAYCLLVMCHALLLDVRMSRSFYVLANVGNISFQLALDTASSDLWLLSSDCTSSTCSSIPQYPLTYESSTFGIVNGNLTEFNISFADTTGTCCAPLVTVSAADSWSGCAVRRRPRFRRTGRNHARTRRESNNAKSSNWCVLTSSQPHLPLIYHVNILGK